MNHFLSIILIAVFAVLSFAKTYDQAVIIDHTCTDLSKIPQTAITAAREKLRIVYTHTSHGSQLTSGMNGVFQKYGDLYKFGTGSASGQLYLHDRYETDLGNGSWADLSRGYLTADSSFNVVIWSWCGQVSGADTNGINDYLKKMSDLEALYPDVHFVYMTGHLDGSGETGTLHKNNQRIRNYCIKNRKALFDFADIESYGPDGTCYLTKNATDECNYDTDGNGSADGNWAEEWCSKNAEQCFYQGDCAHSKGLNCQRKGMAAWWLWANLAGWEVKTAVGKSLPENRVHSLVNIHASRNQIRVSTSKTDLLAEVMNMKGQLVGRTSLKAGRESVINVAGNGLHIVKIKNGGQTILKRTVVTY